MSLTEGKNILVYVETAGDTPVGPALEILAKAKELAGAKGEKVIAAVLAKEPDAAARTAIEAGADEAVIVKTEEKRPEERAAMLAKLVEKYTPALVLAAATQEGKDVTPLAAQKFDAGCAVDVMNIVADGDQYVFTCPVYGGNVLNDVVLHTRPAVATVRGGSFSKSIEEGKAGKIIEETIEIAARKAVKFKAGAELNELIK